MMENRSFDHFLGWLPHADGRQAGLDYADPNGAIHKTYHQSPSHSSMAAASKTPTTPTIAIGYYEAKDRPFMSRLAQAYTTCDRYFCSILGPTYPNRFFQHCGQTDRLDDGGPTGKYDASDIPFLTLWGDKYTSIWRPPTPPAGPTSASPWPQNPLPRPTTPGPPWPPRP